MAASVFLWALVVLTAANSEAGEVCYGKYGCFNNNPPFNRFGIPLPQSTVDVKTTFHVVTKGGSGEIDDSNAAKLHSSGYIGSKKTVVIIHGWNENVHESKWLNDLKAAFLSKIDGNLIIVDWKEGAAQFYTQAVANTRLVGAQVAVLIKFINANTGNGPSSFHVIGFSLGAQVAGYVGRRLQSAKLARITGLDPAGLYYTGEHIDVRLDSSDAAFVDVIHSDAGLAGTTSKSGHMDFYPNNGKNQRGCNRSVFDLACDHLRAPRYYIDSLLYSCKFKAYSCSNWRSFTHGNCMSCPSSGCPEMGHYADKMKGFFSSGDLYLYTNLQKPFCVFQYAYVIFITGKDGWLKLGGGRNPKIRILGSKGNSEDIELEKRDLPESSVERFIAPINQDLGTLTAIKVWNDLGALADGWKLEQVNIELVSSGQKYHACYDGAWIRTSAVKRPLKSGSGSC